MQVKGEKVANVIDGGRQAGREGGRERESKLC